jgi:hypothetical protein
MKIKSDYTTVNKGKFGDFRSGLLRSARNDGVGICNDGVGICNDEVGICNDEVEMCNDGGGVFHRYIKRNPIKKSLILFLLFFTAASCAFGQNSTNVKRDTTKGFDFFVYPGMYVGNKKNANYYRGYPREMENEEYMEPDPNINYLLNNEWWRKDIREAIRAKNRNAADDFAEPRFNRSSGMRYTTSMSFGIGARYRFTKNLSIGVTLTQARMTAQGVAYLGIKIYETNSNDEFKCMVVGKERRTAFDLTALYIFSTQGMVAPFLEAGMHVNNTKVTNADLVVGDKPFSMINLYGQSYNPTIPQTQLSPKLGGVGYGFSAAAGLRISFNKWAALEPIAQFRFEKINLAGYDYMAPNYNFMLRLVLGDKFFARKKNNNAN